MPNAMDYFCLPWNKLAAFLWQLLKCLNEVSPEQPKLRWTLGWVGSPDGQLLLSAEEPSSKWCRGSSLLKEYLPTSGQSSFLTFSPAKEWQTSQMNILITSCNYLFANSTKKLKYGSKFFSKNQKGRLPCHESWDWNLWLRILLSLIDSLTLTD